MLQQVSKLITGIGSGRRLALYVFNHFLYDLRRQGSAVLSSSLHDASPNIPIAGSVEIATISSWHFLKI
jgi:hypothetical protein